MPTPPVHFAETGEGRVAYQVLGDGDLDLVLMPSLMRWNLDVVWELPRLERFLRRLASFSRLILPQPRSTSLSDPFPQGVATPEDVAHDVISIMDAVDSRRAAVFGMDSMSAPALFLAATYPDRTRALAILNGWSAWIRSEGYPFGMPEDVNDRFFDALADDWGTGRGMRAMSPRLARDERLTAWVARLERLSLSAAQIRRIGPDTVRWDVRGVLGSIRVPTLVLAHTKVPYLPVAHSRYIAEHVPSSIYRERDGEWSSLFWEDDPDWVLDELEGFLTGMPRGEHTDDRVLATVLFTDIVSSTERAAEAGDRRWRDTLEEHDAITRRAIERFRGRRVKSTGDGVLATFDGPARAIRCAKALGEELRPLGLSIRTGLHTGEVELLGEDVTGIAVVIAARVMAEADPDQVLVSHAVPPLVAGSAMEFADLGARSLKGVPGEWRLFAVR